MPPTIVLEGPDGSGKTTCAKKLVERYGFKYVHEGPPPAECDRLAYYASKLLAASRSKKPIIMDRMHLGEIVYGPICRGNSFLGYTGMRLLDRLTNARGIYVVIMLPPFEICEQNWLQTYREGRDYVQRKERFKDIYYHFKGLTAYYDSFDYTRDLSVDELVYLRAGDTVKLPMGVVGNPRARFLVIGERPAGPLNLPFFSMNNSSGFINRALEEAGYLEHDLAFVNAFDISGVAIDLIEVARSLTNLIGVIALGRVAERRCRQQGLLDKSSILSHLSISHPSYHKRFHFAKYDEYIKTLRKFREGCE